MLNEMDFALKSQRYRATVRGQLD